MTVYNHNNFQSVVARLSVVMGIFVVVLYIFYSLGRFYYHNGDSVMQKLPPCILHSATGLKCPSCGLQRACFYLVHGEMIEAMKQNPIVVIAFGIAVITFFKSLFLYAYKGEFNLPQIKDSHVYILTITIIVFTIARNILILI